MQYEIKYGTERHKAIFDAVMARKKLSERHYGNRHQAWKKSEEQHIAYLPESETDRRKRARRESGEPEFTTVVVPYSYAILMSAHTYWTSVFLGRNPVHQLTGRHGETQQQVMAMEALLDYQVSVGRHLLPYYVWLLDAGKYGVGILGQYWDDEYITVSAIERRQKEYNGIVLEGEFEKKKITKRLKGYSGSKVYNVRPYEFFPDPRVPLHRLQDGEFCGRETECGWSEIAEGEQTGRYFNVEELRRYRREAFRQKHGSNQIVLPGDTNSGDTFADHLDTGFVSLFEMHIKLVPKEWGLGSSPYPEKWVFTIANEKIIIGARPLGELHDKFPFFILEYEIDGYALFKRSMYEIVQPMQDLLNWLINTHFYNVRRSLNDMFVVDPQRIVLKDLLDPRPGKIIRAKPGVYGTDIRNAIHQFQVSDVTRAHLSDAEMVMQMIQRVTGVTDNIMGMVNQGGRKTATEIRSSNQFGANRLKTNTEFFSAGGFSELAQVLIASTQQHYDDDKKFKVAGRLLGNEVSFMQIDPEMISGFFDFVPVDGTMPIDRFAQVTMWTQMLQQARQFPELVQGFDMAKMFAWVMQLAGIKNVDQFRVQVMPDGMAEQAAQAGNLIPMGGNGGGNTQRVRGGATNAERPVSPARASGLGPIG